MNSKMDVSSVSQDVSSVWAVAVPRTVARKGIVPQTTPRATSRRFSDSGNMSRYIICSSTFILMIRFFTSHINLGVSGIFLTLPESCVH